jgi:undecaprenyl-diphosphatase
MRSEADPDQNLIASWTLIGVLAVLFAGLAILAHTVGTLPGDLWMTHHLQRLHGAFVHEYVRVATVFGTTRLALPLLVLALIGTVGRRLWRETWFLLMLFILRALVSAVKPIVASPRPDASQAIVRDFPGGFGFPSGHTLTSTVVFGGAAVLAIRLVPWRPRALPWIAGVIWAIGAGSTGFARVWDGAHWTSDVIGGALLGTVVVLLAANLSCLVIGMRREGKQDVL